MAGGIVGTLFGLIGLTLGATARPLALLFGAAVMVLGWSESGGRHLPLVQFDREIRRRWVDEGASRWAAKNGASLGAGLTSRIGFTLWYWLPLGIVASPNPLVVGPIVYGLYASTRAGLVVPMIRWNRSRRRVGEVLLEWRAPARRVSGFATLGFGTYVIITSIG